MKKVIIAFVLLFSLFIPVYAEEEEKTTVCTEVGTIEVATPEKIPGLQCEEWVVKDKDGKEIANKWYTCCVKKGFGAFMSFFWAIIKYATFIAGLVAVLFVVLSGIAVTMSGFDQEMRNAAKKRLMISLGGLLLLIFSGTILNLVAPWIYK